jgi:hypothetical protein
MYFTGFYFLVTKSRTIRFITVMHLIKRKKKIIVEAMRKAGNVYQGKGRKVTDFEFTETEKKKPFTHDYSS